MIISEKYLINFYFSNLIHTYPNTFLILYEKNKKKWQDQVCISIIEITKQCGKQDKDSLE